MNHELLHGDSPSSGIVEDENPSLGIDSLSRVHPRRDRGPPAHHEALDDRVVDEHPHRQPLAVEDRHGAPHDALDDVVGLGRPRLVVAEVCPELAVGASGDVEVGGGLFAGVRGGEEEEAEGAERAAVGRAAARAAVVGDVGLGEGGDGGGGEAERGLDVELRGAAERKGEDGAVVDGDAGEGGGVHPEGFHFFHGPLEEVRPGLVVQRHRPWQRLFIKNNTTNKLSVVDLIN